MYRLILVVLLLTVLYYLLRHMFRGFKTPLRDGQQTNSTVQGPNDEQDQMIEDPVCHIFVPKRIALVERIGGREYCFCSKECAGRFRSEHPV